MQVKDYIIKPKGAPALTKLFRNPPELQLSDDNQINQGIGIDLAVNLPWTTITVGEGGIWEPMVELYRQAGLMFALTKQRRGFLGDKYVNAVMDDGSTPPGYINGLMNFSTVSNVGSVTNAIQKVTNMDGADNTLTTAGDIWLAIENMMLDVRNVRLPGEWILVTTPGIFAEPFLHQNQYQPMQNDMDRIKIDWFGYGQTMTGMGYPSSNPPMKQIAEWWVTDDLYAGAASASEQQMLLFLRSPMAFSNTIIWPQQTLAMLNGKVFERDVSECMLFGNAIIPKIQDQTVNAVPAVCNNSAITTTTIGWIGKSMRVL
jgi:hypothetical protein